jgi:hypothetical protein
MDAKQPATDSETLRRETERLIADAERQAREGEELKRTAERLRKQRNATGN